MPQKKRKKRRKQPYYGKTNREYKDRLFKYIFGNPEHKEWTLSLYNAVNGTNYSDPEEIVITTINDALYMGMKNDVSFLMTSLMNMFEQQSTYNPNVPMRFFVYGGMLYAAYIEMSGEYNIYSSKLQKAPAPRCVCFYNGTDEQPDRQILKLSDAFPEGSKPDIEVKVTMINVNYGHNAGMMSDCKPLEEYAWLIDRIRRNAGNNTENTGAAVNKALDEMPEDFVIRPFLIKNRAEVTIMCITEYNEEKNFAAVRKEEREEGRAEGRAEGKLEATLQILAGLIKDGILSISDAAKRAGMSVSEFEIKAGLKA